jgi:hypothetical protein
MSGISRVEIDLEVYEIGGLNINSSDLQCNIIYFIVYSIYYFTYLILCINVDNL